MLGKNGQDEQGSAIVPGGLEDPAVTVHLGKLLQVTKTSQLQSNHYIKTCLYKPPLIVHTKPQLK